MENVNSQMMYQNIFWISAYHVKGTVFFLLEKFTFVRILSKIEWASKNGVIFFVVKDKKIQVLIYEWESEVHTICREKKYEEKHTDLGKKYNVK